MFQINYHIRDPAERQVPMNVERNVPNGHVRYLELQNLMDSLSQEIKKLGVLEYPDFIEELRRVYQNCQLRRLDSFVI